MDPVCFPPPLPAPLLVSGPLHPFNSSCPDGLLSLVLTESGSAGPVWIFALTFGGDGGAPFLVSHALTAGQSLKSRANLVTLVTQLAFHRRKHQMALFMALVSPISDLTLSRTYLDADLPALVNRSKPFPLPSCQDVFHLIRLGYFADPLSRGSRR